VSVVFKKLSEYCWGFTREAFSFNRFHGHHCKKSLFMFFANHSTTLAEIRSGSGFAVEINRLSGSFHFDSFFKEQRAAAFGCMRPVPSQQSLPRKTTSFFKRRAAKFNG